MRCTVLHDCGGRLRIATGRDLTMRQADVLEYYVSDLDGVKSASVHERTGDIVITYDGDKSVIYNALARFRVDDPALNKAAPQTVSRQVNRDYQSQLFNLVAGKLTRDLVLPLPLRTAWNLYKAAGFVKEGLVCVRNKEMKAELLDALSVGVSVLRGDMATAGMVMFLLDLGGLLEEWTHKKSVSDLAESMSLNVDKVWLVHDDTEIEVPITQVEEGDIISVHAGQLIPLDGCVTSGEAAVNQAAMTGEALPVRKHDGTKVYAGTVIEEGHLFIRVDGAAGSGRYDRVIRMIEDSEKLKSSTETRALALADRVVPYSLGATALTLLLTQNVARAVSVLMVDYSCALRLAMPLSFLSAMRECGNERIVVKGGKYLEAMAQADTIVFDKTGTLTNAIPKVAEVVALAGYNETDILRIAACLEEHFPHSMANAVVREAAERGVLHEEMHSDVEYIVAHGIASHIQKDKVIIGSYHFVFEDEQTTIDPEDQETFDNLDPACSHLYLALDHRLIGVILISDPLRDETPHVIATLGSLGFDQIVMMTGDSDRTAKRMAHDAGVTRYYSEVLPEDKANYVKQLEDEGHTVIMVGDGINDSPALSQADVGIAIGDGAAIAREVADITIRAESLQELVYLRQVSQALERRIRNHYSFILGFNSLLIALGAIGILPAATTALLHNGSTLLISFTSMTNLIDEKEMAQANTRAAAS